MYVRKEPGIKTSINLPRDVFEQWCDFSAEQNSYRQDVATDSLKTYMQLHNRYSEDAKAKNMTIGAYIDLAVKALQENEAAVGVGDVMQLLQDLIAQNNENI